MAKRSHHASYKKEYARDQASAKDIAERGRRNKARAQAEKKGLVHKGDGKEVHHVGAGARGKTKVISRHANRVKANKSAARRR